MRRDVDTSPKAWASRLGLRKKGQQFEGACPVCGDGGKGAKSNRLHVKHGDVPGKVLAHCRICKSTFERLLYATFEELDPDSPNYIGNGSARPTRKQRQPKVKGRDADQWFYFHESGTEYCRITKVIGADGSKAFYPDPVGLKGPHPLYCLSDLIERSADPVLVVEGEKAADAAQELLPGHAVTTSMGGSNRPQQSDWQPLAGRDVTIWPDADEPGSKYAWAVYDLALEAGAADVRVIRLPDGFDLADPLPEGFDLGAIIETRATVPGLAGLVPIAEFMAMETEARNWLVQDLLPADGLAVVVSGPKVGKSTLARCLSVAVADPNRSEFLDRGVKTGAVIYLSLEERPATVKGHYNAIGFTDGIHVSWKQAGDIAPDVAGRMETLTRWIRAHRPALVIIDTMIRFLPMTRDELNDYPTVSAAMEPFIGLARKYGTCIFFVHHSRKSGGEYGNDALGSTALAASMDTAISLKRTAAGRCYTVTGRDGVEQDTPIALSLSEGQWIDAAGTRAQVTYRSIRDRVRRALFDVRPDPLTRAELFAAVEASHDAVLRAARELSADGEIEIAGKGVCGDPHLYRYLSDRAECPFPVNVRSTYRNGKPERTFKTQSA